MSREAVLDGPEKVTIAVQGWRCLRCFYEWVSRRDGVRPRQCARCKTAWWDQPKPLPKKSTTAEVVALKKALKAKSSRSR